jgi:riboflavin transporter FmnP
MNAKAVALVTTFAALAIVLNTIRIPTLYWPGWFYTLSEIPVLVAFLIYGFKIGFLVEVLHITGQEIFFPIGPGGLVVYPMGIIVMPLMFLGLYLAKSNQPEIIHWQPKSERKITIYRRGFATAIRGGIMPIVDYFIVYSFLLPIALGKVIPESIILGLVPAFIVYNVTSSLYAVPVAYFIAKQASKHLRVEAHLL